MDHHFHTITIYLAGPIFLCEDDEASAWRDYVKKKYGNYDGTGWDTFRFLDPMRRDYRGKEDESANRIVQLDKLDILHSDCLLVYYHKPSVGTAMEILFAYEHHKPVFLVCRDNKFSPWLKYHSTAICLSFDQAMDEIRSIF